MDRESNNKLQEIIFTALETKNHKNQIKNKRFQWGELWEGKHFLLQTNLWQKKDLRGKTQPKITWMKKDQIKKHKRLKKDVWTSFTIYKTVTDLCDTFIFTSYIHYIRHKRE